MPVTVIRDSEAEWEEVSADWKAKQKAGDPGLRFKRLIAGWAGGLNMQRTEYRPGHHEAPHRHPEDEIIHVLAGEIHFGRDVLRAGDSIFVPRDTTYSLHTPSGAQFLRVGLGQLVAPEAEPAPA